MPVRRDGRCCVFLLAIKRRKLPKKKRVNAHDTSKETARRALVSLVDTIQKVLGNSCRRHCRLHWVKIVNRSIHADLSVSVGGIAFARDMPSLTTLVADFPNRVEGSTIRGSTVARNMTLYLSVTCIRVLKPFETTDKFSTSIALHGLGLAIPGIMIRAAAFVARCWTGSCCTTCKPSSEATTVATTGYNGTTTSTKTRSTLETSIRARALQAISARSPRGYQRCLQPDDPVGHKNSNDPRFQPHLCVELGNRLGHGQVLDNDNTAWLEYMVSAAHNPRP